MSEYSYSDQLVIIKQLRLADGQYLRRDCPFCGGKNTFGVTRDGDRYTWGCFRVSCDARGTKGGDRGMASVRSALTGEEPVRAVIRPIPSVLTSIDHQPAALNFLARYNSLTAYNAGLVNIKYSPLEDRIMFPVHNLQPIGYTGRARNGVFPKWLKYGDCNSLFTCGRGRIAVLVEDAPSACAVGIIPTYTGCALLGTQLYEQHVHELQAYKQVIVCLDPDAMTKALQFVSKIQGVVNTTMRLIPDDLKYFGPERIMDILE